jgi:hypothetical protein
VAGSWDDARAEPRRPAAARRGVCERSGFTYTVLEGGGGRVIGCVYIYPSDSADGAADVRSWVRADRADLDVAVHDAVSGWLDSAWPFSAVSYASRTGS